MDRDLIIYILPYKYFYLTPVWIATVNYDPNIYKMPLTLSCRPWFVSRHPPSRPAPSRRPQLPRQHRARTEQRRQMAGARSSCPADTSGAQARPHFLSRLCRPPRRSPVATLPSPLAGAAQDPGSSVTFQSLSGSSTSVFNLL
jgi:hypothetical protein